MSASHDAVGKYRFRPRDYHCKAFMLMILVWISFAAFVMYLLRRELEEHIAITYPIWIAFPVAYFFYIVEALLCNCDKYRNGLGSSTCAYLYHVQARTSIEDTLALIKCAAPIFRMCVECYHYKTCEITKYYVDRGGRERSHLRKERRKIVTHTATSNIQYGAWKDCSTKVGKLEGSQIIRLKFERDYEFHDEETHNSFRHQRLHFQRENDVDKYQAYTEEFLLPDFPDMVVCTRHGKHPCCMNLCSYILASIFTFSYPYRVWLSKISEDKTMDVRKRVSASPLAMQQLPQVQKYLQSGDTAIQKALVYQEIYGRAEPGIPISVARAVDDSLNAEIPLAYSLPFTATLHLAKKSIKEERKKSFAQIETPKLPLQSKVELQQILNNSEVATPREKDELVSEL